MLKRIIGITVIFVSSLSCSTGEAIQQSSFTTSTTSTTPTTSTTSTTSTTPTTSTTSTTSTIPSGPVSLSEGRPEATGLNAPDPEIVVSGDTYFLFATNGWTGKGFYNVPVWKSQDLENWEWAGDALPKVGAWADALFTWAPGVLETDNGWVLYYTARVKGTTDNPDFPAGEQCIGVATSDKPQGPYVDRNDEPFICQHSLGGSIDPSPFIDKDGTFWLLWKSDANAPHVNVEVEIFSQELDREGITLLGEAVPIFGADVTGSRIIENPDMLYFREDLYLVFSAGWWEDETYSIGAALCSAVQDPCDLVDFNAGSGTYLNRPIVGPGGASVIDNGQEILVVFHAWVGGTAGNGGTRRAVVVTAEQLVKLVN